MRHVVQVSSSLLTYNWSTQHHSLRTLSSKDQGGGCGSTRAPKRIAFPFEPRSENRGVHGILKAVPHVRSTFIFDVHVEFARPQRAISPGQAVVLYDGDAVLGGGRIS